MSVAAQAIEDVCREALAAALKEFPAGCDEDQMQEFLKVNCKYPGIAYSIAMGWDYKKLIDQELTKYGNEKGGE